MFYWDQNEPGLDAQCEGHCSDQAAVSLLTCLGRVHVLGLLDFLAFSVK